MQRASIGEAKLTTSKFKAYEVWAANDDNL